MASRIALLKDGRIAFHGELDELKDRVKRLRISPRPSCRNSFAVPGALRCELDGPVAVVTVDDFDEEILDDLRTTWVPT